MNLDLSGKRALVCGASQGIGQACAVELAALGASVVCAARDSVKLSAAVAGLPTGAGPGHVHHALRLDLSDPATAAEAVSGHVAAHGPIHVLVNNTGGPPAGSAIEASAEQLLAAFTSQLVAAHLIVRALLSGFKAAHYGRVINITSTSVRQPIPNLAISNIVRPAVASWAKCLSMELGVFGVTVNNILPGYTSTERLESLVQNRAAAQGVSTETVKADWERTTPVGRIGRPEEIAAAVAFLASPAAAYITGINLPVDGGRLSIL